MNIVLRNEAAKIFYEAATEGCKKFTGFGRDFSAIGGYWKEEWENIDIWIAYDFGSGSEVFLEEFDDEGQAFLYARGIEAKTKDRYII